MSQAEMEASPAPEQGAAPDEEHEAVNETEEQSKVADEEATSEAEGEEQEPKPKPKSRLEQRFSELTSQRDAERLQKEQMAAQVKSLSDQLAQFQAQGPLQQHMAQKPTLESCDFDSQQYEQRLFQWVEQGSRIQAQAQQQAQREIQTRGKLQGIVASGAQKYPDFQQVVTNPSVPDLSVHAPAAYQALLGSDAAVDLAYTLAKDPAKVHAISLMDPVMQIREITRMEAKLTAAPAPKPPATDPPATVSGVGAPVIKDPDKMTDSEFRAWRRRQRAERGKR